MVNVPGAELGVLAGGSLVSEPDSAVEAAGGWLPWLVAAALAADGELEDRAGAACAQPTRPVARANTAIAPTTLRMLGTAAQ